MFPPLRFAAVEEGVYRSGYPTLRNLRFLRRLRLRKSRPWTTVAHRVDRLDNCCARMRFYAMRVTDRDGCMDYPDTTHDGPLIRDPDRSSYHANCDAPASATRNGRKRNGRKICREA